MQPNAKAKPRLSEAAANMWAQLSAYCRVSGARCITVHDVDFEDYRALHDLWAFGVIKKPDHDALASTTTVWLKCRCGSGQEWLENVAEVDR